MIQQFEDIIAWKKSQLFAIEIYTEFSKIKDFGFKDQICRAVISISNNIAEGYDRHTKKEFVRFLYIAHASCSEVKSMLYLATPLQYISLDQQQKLMMDANEISKLLRGLIKSCS